jgi:hypothetical protein
MPFGTRETLHPVNQTVRANPVVYRFRVNRPERPCWVRLVIRVPVPRDVRKSEYRHRRTVHEQYVLMPSLNVRSLIDSLTATGASRCTGSRR